MVTKSDADRIEKTTLGGAGGNMAPIRTTTEEIERIVEISMLKLDLKYTNELNNLRKEWRDTLTEKGRWNFSAIVSTIMALIALSSVIISIFR